MIRQRAAYEALAVRLEDADLDLLIGEPTALHRLPAAYLISTTVSGAPSSGGPIKTFGSPAQRVVRLQPTLTLAVAYQDHPEAEWQIVDLVDRVAGVLWQGPLDDVCTAQIETVTYQVRAVGGIDYRLADLVLNLTQM